MGIGDMVQVNGYSTDTFNYVLRKTISPDNNQGKLSNL